MASRLRKEMLTVRREQGESESGSRKIFQNQWEGNFFQKKWRGGGMAYPQRDRREDAAARAEAACSVKESIM